MYLSSVEQGEGVARAEDSEGGEDDVVSEPTKWGLRVAMGVTYGEVSRKENISTMKMDYLGSTVSSATKLQAACPAGMILASEGFVRQVPQTQDMIVMEVGADTTNKTDGKKLFGLFPRALSARAEHVLNSSASLTGVSVSGLDTASTPGSPGTQMQVEDVSGDLKEIAESQWKIPFEELVIKDNLGAGSYGEIYRAMYHGTPVAVKRLLNQSPKLMYTLLNECQILKQLRHPNIVMFMGGCFEPGNLCLVIDYCSNGSLADLLQKKSMKLDWPLRLKIAKQTAMAMQYLHSRKPAVIHCELKPHNILLDHSMTVKISDFALSKIKTHHKTMTQRGGNLSYTAPEILRGDPFAEPVDVYAFAMVCYALSERQDPFSGMTGMVLVHRILDQNHRPALPLTMPLRWASLIRACWPQAPQQRPHFDKVLTLIEELEAPGALSMANNFTGSFEGEKEQQEEDTYKPRQGTRVQPLTSMVELN